MLRLAYFRNYMQRHRYEHRVALGPRGRPQAFAKFCESFTAGEHSPLIIKWISRFVGVEAFDHVVHGKIHRLIMASPSGNVIQK